MPDVTITHVPHLGGIDVAYRMFPHDPNKPTIVLVPPYTIESDIFREQFDDKHLTETANLIAIDPLGHGRTRATKRETWTYWDSAEMNLQILDRLDIEKVFVLGSAQGGFICVRMALMEPDRVNILPCEVMIAAMKYIGTWLITCDKILGMILMGTSLDAESEESRSRNCWDAPAVLTPIIDGLSMPEPTPDFVIEPELYEMVFDSGLGPMAMDREWEFWQAKFREHYRGDDGRRRLRMACINARDRDGLHGRLRDVRCPVLWLHVSCPYVIAGMLVARGYGES